MMFTGLRLPIVSGKKKAANKVLTITAALDGEFSSFSVCKKTCALNTNQSSIVWGIGCFDSYDRKSCKS